MATTSLSKIISGFATGYTGSQGAGFTGSQGITGNFGGATFDYTFDTTTTNADPGVGKIRFNNANVTLATQMYIDDQNDGATDIQTFLRTIDDSTSTIKGHFRVSNKVDANDFALYTISSITEQTGYFLVNCAYVSGSATAFTNLEDVIITFARTGDIGATGFTGSYGYAGGLQWAFDTTTTMAAPSTGNFRFNSATPSSVSAMAFSITDFLGNGHRNYLVQWANSTNPVKAYIVLTGYLQRDYVFEVTSVVDNTTWVQLNVSFVSGAGALTPAASEVVSINLARSGNLGFTGSQGAGFTGSAGTNGFTGSVGFTGSAGTNGFTGSAGTNGFTGSQGNTVGYLYQFSTSTTASDPGTGFFRLNTDGTQMYISVNDSSAINRSTPLGQLALTPGTRRAIIFLMETNTGSTISIDVTGDITNNGTWLTIPTLNKSGNLPANNEFRRILGVRNGADGATGFTGSGGGTSGRSIAMSMIFGR